MALMPLLAAVPAAAQANAPADCLRTAFADVADLADGSDRRVGVDRFTGRLTVVTLLPRRCDAACAMRMLDLDAIARSLPSSRVAFVAIDTGGRSAAALNRLAATWHQAARRWTLLRGTDAAIATLRRRLDVAPADAAEPSALVAVFDADGMLRQRYSGAPLDRDRVAREIATLATLPRATVSSSCSASSAIQP